MAEALNDTLPDTPLNGNSQIFGHTMHNDKAKTVDPLADTLQLVKAETNFDTLRNVRVGALVDTLAETVLDAKVKTLFDRLSDLKAETLINRLVDNISEAEAELLGGMWRPTDSSTRCMTT